ncbi:MAG: type II toxin-antitoxin system prevent-host-death family antitoxin [Acidimicrobiia bacterium]
MIWALQDAKQRFSELVDRARSEGAQIVTRRGREVVVVLAVERYRELVGDGNRFKEFLLAGPDLSQLEIVRSDAGRVVDL